LTFHLVASIFSLCPLLIKKNFKLHVPQAMHPDRTYRPDPPKTSIEVQNVTGHKTQAQKIWYLPTKRKIVVGTGYLGGRSMPKKCNLV
jgi:hypothetical protein